jgi:glycosyltransferase involved in cell wall biosynthesis
LGHHAGWDRHLTVSSLLAGQGGHALLLVQNLPVPFDRRVWAEAKALVADGWRVSVVSPGFAGAPWHELRDGVEIYRYPLAVSGEGLLGHVREYVVALPSLAILAGLAHLRQRVDVFHAANPPDFFFPVAMFLRWRGAAFVFDQHDPAPELYVAQGGHRGGLVERFLRWCERQTFLAADVVIATNESVREIATRRGRVSPARVVVVRSAVDTSRTFRVDPDHRLKAGRRFLVVYLGVMGPQDGIDLFVRAARVVCDLMPGAVRFLAIGDGSERVRARELAERLGLDDIEFPGSLSDEAVRTALSTADVAIGPDPANGFNELCTMNKTLEYMAMGIPVVCFDLRETRASAGDAAVYATPNDPADLARRAVELLSEPERRASLAQVGLARMDAALSWDKSVVELRRAYGLAHAAAKARRR